MELRIELPLPRRSFFFMGCPITAEGSAATVVSPPLEGAEETELTTEKTVLPTERIWFLEIAKAVRGST